VIARRARNAGRWDFVGSPRVRAPGEKAATPSAVHCRSLLDSRMKRPAGEGGARETLAAEDIRDEFGIHG
jgi:hypothetical protein